MAPLACRAPRLPAARGARAGDGARGGRAVPCRPAAREAASPRRALAGAAGPLLPLLLLLLPARAGGAEGFSKLEQEELEFMRSSLQREVESVASRGAPEDGGSGGAATANEDAIRRAYRNIARRYKKNIFSDPTKFEFQMRILNLARDALVRGEHLGAGGWGARAEEAEDDNATRGPGRELPSGSRASDEILKQMHGWQEYALEEGVHFDDPETPFFVGHTQHGFRDAFAGLWDKFVRTELADRWPATRALKLQAEAECGGDCGAQPQKRLLVEARREWARDALVGIVDALHACGSRGPPFDAPLPRGDDAAAWAALHLAAATAIRAHFAGDAGTCGDGAAVPERLAVLELSLEGLEHLAASDGQGRKDVGEELRATHAAVEAMRMATLLVQTHCKEAAAQKVAKMEALWQEYQFGPLIKEAYPADGCGLEGVAVFVRTHAGREGELLPQRAEPDRSVLRAVRGLLALQQALTRPASLSIDQWRDAVGGLEDAVWRGIAFPELHEATGGMLAEVASAGLMPLVLEATLEHPPVRGGPDNATLRHGRDPGDLELPREPRFSGLDVPGFSMLPVQRYEERALHLWGDEEDQSRWDPVRLGLSYMDLTPACDLPIQVAMCFLSAAQWFWRALDILGDKCGGDAWLDEYIFEDIWSAPPAAKRLAMQYALKKAIMALVEYATQMASHQLPPGARLSVQRTGHLLLTKLAARFGTAEDAPAVVGQLKSYLDAARLSPVWAPPTLVVSDAVFLDILGGKLHQAFLEKLVGGTARSSAAAASVLPSAVPEHAAYEAMLLGGGDGSDVELARLELMGALLRDTGRGWSGVEADLAGAGWPAALDPLGFVAGSTATPRAALEPAPDRGRLPAEFSAVRGVRVDPATGRASLLLVRPSGESLPLVALEDAAELLAVADQGPVHVQLEQPQEAGAGVDEYPRHPFQRASSGPTGLARRAEAAMASAALALQQVASGTEVAMRAPFPLRDCSKGLCGELPPEARRRLGSLASLRSEPWDAPRLFFECSRLTYAQRVTDDGALEVLFGDPRLEVHPGKPLRALDEELFQSWSVEKLRRAIREAEGPGAHSDELPAVEKHELVGRLLRAVDRGVLLEDEDDSGDVLARFSRRFTHYLPSVLRRWPHLQRLAPLCGLRAAGLVLRFHLLQMNASATQHAESLRYSGRERVESARQEQAELWREALAEVHGKVLMELGFVDLDPGRCWEGRADGLGFARCCSVGDLAARCWGGEAQADADAAAPQSARELELRCCGGMARRGPLDPRLVLAVASQLAGTSQRRPDPQGLVPAVEVWLRNPAGQAEDGTPLSELVLRQVVEEIDEEHPLPPHADEQLWRPVERLRADLDALGAAGDPEPARFAGEEGAGTREAWLPLPPLAGGAGSRRAAYVTVALAPQLAQVAPEDLRPEPGAGSVEEVDLGALAGTLAARRAESAEGAAAEAGVRQLREAEALLRSLHGRTEELELRAGPLRPAAPGAAAAAAAAAAAEEAPRSAECTADGWRELAGGEAEAGVFAGARVRTRRRGSEDITGDEGLVRAVLTLSGEPGVLTRVWQVVDPGTGGLEYFDFSDHAIMVSVPCNVTEVVPPAGARGPAEEGEGGPSDAGRAAEGRRWPLCVEANVALPSSNGTGLFVNLQALGISSGCFQDDCSHSDHFACASPAECARACARIGACRRWTFQEAAPPTCWLRGRGPAARQNASGAVSGAASCVPPREGDGTAELTLFGLVGGPTGALPPGLWEEWELADVLREFGHMTAEEVRLAAPSTLQHSARRVLAIALAARGHAPG